MHRCPRGRYYLHMEIVRAQITVRGQVQGVGFRPYIFRLARELGLAGHVANNPDGVQIDVEGPPERVAAFTRRLGDESPPLAVIDSVSSTPETPTGRDTFVIRPSEGDQTGPDWRTQEARITPDVRVCDDCLREVRDPSDRRCGYAFTNCTNCGPRYSIIHGVPYDRPNTTMARFAMCPACRAEYENPADRRFHAQPNACPECGPRLWLVRPDGSRVHPPPAAPIGAAADAIRSGSVVAVKGIGGFHLACQADADQVVRGLRRRKNRETKPFAVMVADLPTARRIAEVSDDDARLLTSPAAPIVLLPKRDPPGQIMISEAVAPDTGYYGLMLPYSPLHHLLFDQGLGPLVMTSGNPSDEPLCADNDEALRRLAPLADLLLMHDRDIHAPNDDSLVVGGISPAVPLRRARGYVPAVVSVLRAATRPILALGGDLKATFCVLNGHEAVLSEHLGELPSAEAFRHYTATIERLCRLLRVAPQLLAHDLHPGYQSTAYARSLAQEFPAPALAVQHHHAHLVSCLAENGATQRAVGLTCDGTGYGMDGAIWGCEVLVGDDAGFERAAHLSYYALPGGDAAARQTWRPAVSLLREAYGDEWRAAGRPVLARIDGQALQTIERMLQRKLNCPPTSSLGRLFDAVAFLIGLCDYNGHEAQAAMAVEAAAGEHPNADPLAYDISDPGQPGPIQLDVRPTIRAVVEGVRQGRSAAELAGGFQATMAAMLAQAAELVARRNDLDTVALSGGCFLNRLLLEGVRRRLHKRGLNVLTHRRVPPGDGGLSLGQAVIAARHFTGIG